MESKINEKHIPYYKALESIRKSSEVNMWGAAPHLYRMFPELSLDQAKEILVEWIENYNELKEQLKF